MMNKNQVFISPSISIRETDVSGTIGMSIYQLENYRKRLDKERRDWTLKHRKNIIQKLLKPNE